MIKINNCTLTQPHNCLIESHLCLLITQRYFTVVITVLYKSGLAFLDLSQIVHVGKPRVRRSDGRLYLLACLRLTAQIVLEVMMALILRHITHVRQLKCANLRMECAPIQLSVFLSQLLFSNAELFFLLVVELALEETHRPRALRAFGSLSEGHGVSAVKYGLLYSISLIR